MKTYGYKDSWPGTRQAFDPHERQQIGSDRLKELAQGSKLRSSGFGIPCSKLIPFILHLLSLEAAFRQLFPNLIFYNTGRKMMS